MSTFPGGTVYALDPDDREFKVRLTGQSQYQPTIKILSPSGKLVKTVVLGGKNKDGSRNPDSETFSVPPDGEKGLYTIQITGYFSGLLAPLTDLPDEVVALTADKPIRTGGLEHGYLGVPPKSAAKLQFTAVPYGPKKETAMPAPTFVRIRDTAGQPVLDTTLLDIGKRDSATVELKSGDKVGVWPCVLFSRWGPAVTWSGPTTGVYFSQNPDAFEPVLRALSEKSPKN